MEKVIVGKYIFKNKKQLMDILDITVDEMRSLFIGKVIIRSDTITIRLEKPRNKTWLEFDTYNLKAIKNPKWYLDKTQSEITIIEEELR